MPDNAWSQFSPIYDDLQRAISKATEEDLERWVCGPGKHTPFVAATHASTHTTKDVAAPTESESVHWIPLKEDLQKQPSDVQSQYGIFTGSSGLSPSVYRTTESAPEIITYQGESGMTFPLETKKTTIVTRDSTGRATWAVAVTLDFYTQYGILPILSEQVLSTQYSGHDWGLIHRALCMNSSVQLLDGLTIYAYANAIDVSVATTTLDIHPNVLYMLDLIEQALHTHNPRHITTATAYGTFHTLQEYDAWYNTPLPPQPDIETGL